MNDVALPLELAVLDRLLQFNEIDLCTVSIRELSILVNELETHFGVEFIRMEFGVPGLLAERIGPEEEIRVLKDQHKLPSTYPPFDGVPRLKKAAALFVKKFLNVNVFSENCVPTVGAMHGCLISMAIAGRRMKKSDTILFLDPGFPVNKLQTKFFRLKNRIDRYV